MSKPLPITQRQVRALCAGAKKEGYAPIVHIGNVLVRLVPEDRAIPPQEAGRIDGSVNPETFTSLDDYLSWRDRENASETQGRS